MLDLRFGMTIITLAMTEKVVIPRNVSDVGIEYDCHAPLFSQPLAITKGT